jgi:hypothetical protein
MEVIGLRYLKTAGIALVAMLVIGAAVAASASAKAPPPKLDLTWNFEENQLKPGEEFKMANDEGITFTTNLGDISCPSSFYPGEQGFLGTDQTNNEKTDKIELKHTDGTWAGGTCSTSTTLGSSAFVETFAFDEPLGSLLLSVKGNKAEVKATSASEPVYVYVGFSGGESCLYDFSKLKGTWKGKEAGYERLEVDFSNQTLKEYKPDSGKLCPKKVKITAAFEYQITGPEGFYIFEHTT